LSPLQRQPASSAGVRIEPTALWPDDRGYFLEVQRIGQGVAAASLPIIGRDPAVLVYLTDRF